jgi:hypothetical protein
MSRGAGYAIGLWSGKGQIEIAITHLVRAQAMYNASAEIFKGPFGPDCEHGHALVANANSLISEAEDALDRATKMANKRIAKDRSQHND